MIQIIIVEDDLATAKLLAQLIRKLWPQAAISHFADGRAALDSWKIHGADLVLLDWGVPGVSGLEVLKEIRRASNEVVCVMITGRAAREMILTARQYRVDAYIVKPFRPQEVMTRLSEVMKSAQAVSRIQRLDKVESLSDFITLRLREGPIGMPIAPKLVEALSTVSQADAEQRTTVLRRCRIEPALVARLLGAANSSYYNTGSTVIETFEAGLDILGLDTLANLAFTLSLQPGSELRDELLLQQGVTEQRRCLDLLGVVIRIGQRIEHDVSACKAACMLYRLGELSLLQILQCWADLGHSLDEAECKTLIQTHRSEAAFQLKAHWQIPTSIRTRAGSAYHLPTGTVKVDDIVMRLAALLVSGQEPDDEIRRLLARLELSEESIDQLRPPA